MTAVASAAAEFSPSCLLSLLELGTLSSAYANIQTGVYGLFLSVFLLLLCASSVVGWLVLLCIFRPSYGSFVGAMGTYFSAGSALSCLLCFLTIGTPCPPTPVGLGQLFWPTYALFFGSLGLMLSFRSLPLFYFAIFKLASFALCLLVVFMFVSSSCLGITREVLTLTFYIYLCTSCIFCNSYNFFASFLMVLSR